MFKRAWLIAVVPPNWIISCGLFFEILEVLELNFHFITTMNFSYLVLVPAFSGGFRKSSRGVLLVIIAREARAKIFGHAL